MEVKLAVLHGYSKSALGRVSIPVPGIWKVEVHDDALKEEPECIPAGMIHVGMIGRQQGANFNANTNFGKFVEPQQEFIVSEAKRLHGAASPDEPCILLDAPPEQEDEYDEE